MSLFKKKDCCCEKTENSKCYSTEKSETLAAIKVLGAGCTSCHKLYENTKKAISHLDLHIEVEYITDLAKVIEYGVMSVPALIVNDKVVSMGKVMKDTEVEALLHKLGF